MISKVKWRLLAVGLALSGLSFAASASAAATTYTESLGLLTAPSNGPDHFISTNLAKGSFIDTMTFSVSNTAKLGAIVYSFNVTNPQGNTVAGVQLTGAFELLQGNQVLATGSINSLVNGNGNGHLTTFTSGIDNVTVSAGKDYSLLFTGTSFSNAGHFQGALSLAPVPEPEEWIMLLLGLPAVYIATRRKSADSLAPAAA